MFLQATAVAAPAVLVKFAPAGHLLAHLTQRVAQAVQHRLTAECIESSDRQRLFGAPNQRALQGQTQLLAAALQLALQHMLQPAAQSLPIHDNVPRSV
jgi:hypothetical protein